MRQGSAFFCATIVALLGACGGGGEGDGTLPVEPPPGVSPPGILSFSPTAGGAGTQVTITGINFATTLAANTVRFNGVDASVISASATNLVAVVPSAATSGPIQVVTAGGTASSARFTVLSGSGANWRTRTFGSQAGTVGVKLAHNGTRFVAVGSGFEAATDPRIWTSTNSFASADDVAWNGQLFVAVGGELLVDTSPDGLSWTMRTLPSGNTADLRAVAGSTSMWVGVGQDGAILSSPDGIAWTVRTSGTTNELTDVVWTGSRFVAVGAGGAVVTSLDGVNWSLQPAPTADRFTAVGASSSLIVASTFPASGSGFPQVKVLTSADGGVTWTTAATDIGGFSEIIYAGGRFVGVGSGRSATSIDGVVWIEREQQPSGMSSVVYVDNQYVATDGDTTVTSPDGLNWTIVQSARDIVRIARSPVDGRLVAAGGVGTVRSSTDDGATWTFAPLESAITGAGPVLDLVWAPSAAAFVAHVQLAANQDAYTSPDGVTWTRRGYMPCYGALAASPTRLVNVGSSSTGPCVSSIRQRDHLDEARHRPAPT